MFIQKKYSYTAYIKSTLHNIFIKTLPPQQLGSECCLLGHA